MAEVKRSIMVAVWVVAVVLLAGVRLYAQSPFETAALRMEAMFLFVARPLSVVAVVYTGIMYYWSHHGGGSERLFNLGVGLCLVLGAAQIVAWIF